MIDASKYFDLNIFWKIAQEEGKVNQKTKDLAINCLVDILNRQNQQIFENYLSKADFFNFALQNLERDQSVYMSLQFIQQLLLTYQLESL